MFALIGTEALCIYSELFEDAIGVWGEMYGGTKLGLEANVNLRPHCVLADAKLFLQQVHQCQLQ